MIGNTNDGSESAPRMRCYLNLMMLEDLPEWSAGPKSRDPRTVLEAVKAAGYEGVQFVAPASAAEIALCEELGLGRCGLGRVNKAADADGLAARLSGEGQECGTVHLGWGTEEDDEADRLIASVMEASVRRGIPLYVETHRATLFQDIWRSVQFVRRHPELRFNGDFSHWYTGLEMVYGVIESKIATAMPVIDRVRFMHGRIGDPGAMQVDIGDGSEDGRPYVGHFREMWRAVFGSFRRQASSGDYILFVPELLSPRIYYAREVPTALGPREEGDRWRQSLVLRRIAEECFGQAAYG